MANINDVVYEKNTYHLTEHDDQLRTTNGVAIIDNKKANTGEISVGSPVFGKLQPSRSYAEFIPNAANYPDEVQNGYNFPKVRSIDRVNRLYNYSYYMDYSDINLDDDLKKLRKTLNYSTESKSETVLRQTSMFNRFKVPVAGDAFAKGFGHVFFTRPSCNILTYDGTYHLSESLQNDTTFNYGFRNHLDILKQLCGETEYKHDFMMYLINKVQGFDVSDKTMETDAYGRNLMGHQIQYGRTTEKSKVGGTLTVPYSVDRDLLIYNLHNYWIRYISGVYRGKYEPRSSDVVQKIIDYAGACFYIVTAEDFETIIYWTKLYGVFPTSTPDGMLSWKAGSPIKDIDAQVTYAYSWRSDDNDPKVLIDFNRNARYGYQSDWKYVKSYQENRYGIGDTWVEAPFIELFPIDNTQWIPKLRWRSPDL